MYGGRSFKQHLHGKVVTPNLTKIEDNMRMCVKLVNEGSGAYAETLNSLQTTAWANYSCGLEIVPRGVLISVSWCREQEKATVAR